MEVRGVEPLSEKQSIRATTCLAHLLISLTSTRTDTLTDQPVSKSRPVTDTLYRTSTLIAQIQISAIHTRVAAFN